jgi:hypothetical protein
MRLEARSGPAFRTDSERRTPLLRGLWMACAILAALVLHISGLAALRAQSVPPQANKPPIDLSGMWQIHDPGSGNWGAFYDNVPKPDLRPEIIKDNLAFEASAKAGNVFNTTPHTADCPVGDLPMMMASSPPLNILQSRDEILLGTESRAGRVIYLDGRSHPGPGAGYIPSGNGHSVGHWEGDTLVVDTVGFAARICDSRRPVMRTPAGGRVKDTTHLTERYRLLNGGKQLSITLTWEDSTIYLKPFAYSYTYDYLPEATPFESDNDLSDADYLKRQTESVHPPAQK